MRVKTNHHLLIAPVITLVITGLIYAVYDVFPFGNNTISWCDMNQQTIPLLMDFKDILDGKSGIFYSTANAGGMNFWGVFLFFLSSPLYLTVKFVEKSQLIYLVNILFAVKLVLSSLTAMVYFNKCHKRLETKYSVVLSVMYSLCGYGIMYCQTLVWLDIMVLFPLLVLSVDRMCRKGKPLMYGIVLSLMMCICFYLSYMIVIYLLIAVPLCIGITVKKNERKRACVSFVSASVISALVTAPVWLCAFLQTSSSARGGSALTEIMYGPLFKNGANKLCVLMCTALCFAVIPFFRKNKILKNRKVKFNLILLTALMIPVFTDPINKMWHTGSYQSFPLRYGFIIIFTMLVLCAHYFESVECKKKNSKGFVLLISLMTAGFALLSVYVVYSKSEVLSSYTKSLKVDGDAFKILLMLSAIACFIYILCISLHNKNLLGSRLLCTFLMLVFASEVFTSFSVNIGYAVSDGGVLKTSAPLEYDSSEQPLYRTKTEKKYIHVNMVGGLGYNSLSHYTSLTNEDYMFAMKKLGYSSYWMEVGSNGGTAITDALLAVKYSIGAYFDFKSYYDVTNLDGDLERAESGIYSPVGILSSLSPENFGELGDGSRVDIQRELAKRYFGTDKMIYEYKPVFTADGSFDYIDGKYVVDAYDDKNAVCQMRYSIDIKGKQTLYFDIFDRLSNDLSEKYYGSAEIYVNGNLIVSNYPTQKNNGIVTLGEFEDTTAEILIIINKDISVKSMGVFGVDTNLLKQSTEKIAGCDFYTGRNSLSANCKITNESWLYLSVPYDKGLSAYVNGNKAELVRVNEAFCAVKLQKGENEILLKFLPDGMTPAVILSVAGIILCIFVICRRKVLNSAIIKNLSRAVTILLFMAVALAIYVAPLLLKIAVMISGIFN